MYFNYLLLQGSLNLPILGESDSHCKCMGVLMDFSLIVPCLGWKYNDPCVWKKVRNVANGWGSPVLCYAYESYHRTIEPTK